MTQRKLSPPISCRFEPRQIEKLEKISRRCGIKRTDLIRKAAELATDHWIRIERIAHTKPGRCPKNAIRDTFLPKDNKAP